MLPTEPIPANGFRLISGKRSPPKGDKRYEVQFRNSYVDRKHSYTAAELRWIHDGSDWDVVAIRE